MPVLERITMIAGIFAIFYAVYVGLNHLQHQFSEYKPRFSSFLDYASFPFFILGVPCFFLFYAHYHDRISYSEYNLRFVRNVYAARRGSLADMQRATPLHCRVEIKSIEDFDAVMRVEWDKNQNVVDALGPYPFGNE